MDYLEPRAELIEARTGRQHSVSVHDAILSRHSKDLIVGECKDGPTWFGNHLRLDYWVLRRSWTNPAMIGYEVKSGRADFLADQKWRGYLPLCNELWFVVVDKKSIEPSELPDSVGLLRLAGSRLVTVKRAVWREITPPAELMTYILMCRTKIVSDRFERDRQPKPALDFWREWLAESEEKRNIGREVSSALRAKYDRDVQVVRQENENLRMASERLANIKNALEARGINWNNWNAIERVVEEVDAPRWDRETVKRAHETLGKLLNGAG